MASSLVLKGTPNPKQIQFFEATARHIAYGGARGGGKSWAMRRKFILLANRYPGLRLLLMRRTLPELNENHVIPLMKELAGYAQYASTQRVIRFPNDSRIKLGYCDSEEDVQQYQGQEYDVIGLEEATHFTESQMNFIKTCNRNTREDFKPRMYYTCNPGGVGHAWVKRLFIDRDYRNNENPDDYVFIPAKLTDNEVLMKHDPQYMADLMSLPEHLRRAHLEGDWDALEGQYFEEFNRSVHVCAPFPIPSWWKRFRAMDWGYNDPCCVLWFAVGPDRRVFVYDELYVRKTIASRVANMVREKSHGCRFAYTAASPDAWAKRGASDGLEGESVAQIFAKNGVSLTKADNARIVGWQRVREYLQCTNDERPMLQIFDTCANLIRTLPTLTFDKHDKEDVSDHCEDHAAEALRYGLMSRAKTSAQKIITPDDIRRGFDPFAPVNQPRFNNNRFLRV